MASSLNKVTNEHEAIIIGLLLDRSEHFNEIITRVTRDDFCNERNIAVFDIITELYKDKLEVNEVTVAERMKQKGILTYDMALKYLDYCIDILPPYSKKVDIYINNLKDATLKVVFQNKIKNILNQLDKEAIPDICDYISTTDKEIHEIAQRRRVSDFVSIDSVVPTVFENLYARLQERKEKGYASYLTGISSGYEDLDRITGGFRKGEFIVIGARPSVGKTAFALNLIHNIVKKGRAVGFFSLEMSKEEIARRLLSINSGLTSSELNSLNFEFDENRNLIQSSFESDTIPLSDQRLIKLAQRSKSELSRMPIYIDDTSGIFINDLVQKAHKLKDKYKDKLGAIVIDYLGLINNNSKLAQQSRNLQVGEMCHALKGLAKELQIPVITLSQLARPPKKNLGNDKPMMNELKDSGDIEADADIIMLLHRQDYWTGQQGAQENAENSNQNENGENNPTSKTELIISKNRNFKTGQVFFIFSKDKQRFDSYSEEEGI